MRILEKVESNLDQWISPSVKATAILQGFGLWKIPLLFAVRPKVQQLNDEKIEVKIPLNRITKNHLNSMYFGSLAIGADCVVGLLAVHHIRKRKKKVALVFKDFQAEFLKRAEGNVLFQCDDGKNISQLVEEVIATGERKNLKVPAKAVLESDPSVEVARFHLTLSLKLRT